MGPYLCKWPHFLQVDSDGGPADARLRPWWRGRIGFTKQEQLEFFETQHVPESVLAAESGDDDDDYTSSGSSSESELSEGETSSSSSDEGPPPLR